MSLWEEVLDFKEKNGLRFHPLHEKTVKKRVEKIEKNGGKCPCLPDERTCICDQALDECKTEGKCHCLLFCTDKYLVKWNYIDDNGNKLSKEERKKLKDKEKI